MARERTYFFRVSATGLQDLENQLRAMGEAGNAAFEGLKQKSPQFVDAWKRAQEEIARAKKTAEEAAGRGKGLGALAEKAEELDAGSKRVGKALGDVRGAVDLLAPAAGAAGEKLGDLVGRARGVADVFGVIANIIGRNPLLAAVSAAGVAAAAYLTLAKETDRYAASAKEANEIGERSRKLLADTAGAANQAADAKRNLAKADRDRTAELVNEARARLAAAQAGVNEYAGVAGDPLGTNARDEAAQRDRVKALETQARDAQRALEALDAAARGEALAKIAADADAAWRKLNPTAAALRDSTTALQALDEAYEAGQVGRAKYLEFLDMLLGRQRAVRAEMDDSFAALRGLGAGEAGMMDDVRSPADVARDRIAARDQFRGLAETLDPAARAAREYADAQALINEAVRQNPELAERARIAIARLAGEYTEAGRALRDLAAANSDAVLADQIEEARTQAGRDRVAQNQREIAFDDFLIQLEREADLAKLTSEERAIQLKLIEAQKTAGRDLTADEKERLTNAVRAREAAEKTRRDAERAAQEMERAIARSTDRVVDFGGDAIYKALTGKFESAWDFFKDVGLRAIAQVAAEMVFRPIVAPIMQAGVQLAAQAGLGALFGLPAGGAGAAGAAGAGGGVGLTTIGGAGALGYGLAQQGGFSGFWNSIFNTSAPAAAQIPANAVYTIGGNAFLPAGEVAASGGSIFVPAGEVAASGSYMLGGAGSYVPLTASELAQEGVAAAAAGGGTGAAGSILGTIAPYLSIAGGAFGIYNAITNPTPTNIIAGLGGAYAGTSALMTLTGLGPALPFAGPIGLAAAAIGLIGSLFGGKKGKPVVHADQTGRTIGFMPDGSIADYGGNVGYYGANPSSYDYIGDVGKAIRSTIETLGGKAPGFVLGAAYDSIAFPQGLGSVNVTDAQGRWGDGYSPFPGIGIRTGEGMAVDALKVLLPLSEGLDEIYKSVARNSTATKIEDFAKDLDFAKNLKDSVAAIGDLGQALEQVSTRAKAAATAMVDSFGETFDRADALGIGDTASAAIGKQIRAWMGAQGPQETPSQVQAFLAQIEGAFAGISESAGKYGVTPEEVQAANDNAIQRVRDFYNDSIDALLDPFAAAMRAHEKWADQMRADAEDLGLDLVDVERAIAKRRTEVANSALGGLATGVRSALDGQVFDATSSLSPEMRFAEAQRQFAANVDGVRGGDSYAASRLIGSFQTLLGEGRARYGSTADYVAFESMTRSTLENLGAQQGWAGFETATAAQTTQLVNAISIQTAADAENARGLREEIAKLSNRLTMMTAQLDQLTRKVVAG